MINKTLVATSMYVFIYTQHKQANAVFRSKKPCFWVNCSPE